MNLFCKTTVCLTFCVSVLAVTAQADDQPGDKYISLLASGVAADDDRLVDDGFAGGEAAIGVALHQNWNVEGALGFLNMPGNENVGGVDQDQLFLNASVLNVYFRNRPVQPYLLGGLGYGKTTTYNLPDQSNFHINLGVGAFIPVFQERARIRAEVLFRAENETEYKDLIYNIGLSFPFGKKATPPPPPPPAPVEPTDGDNDGVFDDADQCLDTPAGELVDEAGCTLDTDADGVPDSVDQCPDTEAGKEVDEVGCAIVVIIELPGVNFRPNSDMLLGDASTTLNKTAQSLIDNTNLVVEVAGHTDSRGSDELNSDLSYRRADSVRKYLVEAGVDATRVSSRGYGELEPVADNETEAGRAQNRRVELRVLAD